MYIQSLRLNNYRSYESLDLTFSEGTNILYGDNAQGKTNILEALYLIATTHSHRGSYDRDLIRFGQSEAHVRSIIIKSGIDYKVDMHLRAGHSKSIAVNEQRLKRASQLMGLLHIVFFSPEDLTIVKDGPAYRRNFMNAELCQLDGNYLYDLTQYNKILDQRNKLLKEIYDNPGLADTLPVWDEQLLDYGTRIINRRRRFIDNLAPRIEEIHRHLSGGKERLVIAYEPNTTAEDYERDLDAARGRDQYARSTTVGPHKDDLSFIGNDIDLRRFGSQGQQRTCALSLKLAQIELVRDLIGENPVLMLDDVLSELDSSRQNYLLDAIGGVQTFITCTGLDEFVNNRFEIDKLYQVQQGTVTEMN